MRYHFKIHKEGSGFWAKCVELEGCQTQAESKVTLLENMREALNLYLDEPTDSKAIFSLPKKSCLGRNIVTVPVDPKVALAFLLRRYRLKRGLTQTQAAERLGLRGLYSYQRLENSKTANPEFETIIRIKRAFPELDLDDLLAA